MSGEPHTAPPFGSSASEHVEWVRRLLKRCRGHNKADVAADKIVFYLGEFEPTMKTAITEQIYAFRKCMLEYEEELNLLGIPPYDPANDPKVPDFHTPPAEPVSEQEKRLRSLQLEVRTLARRLTLAGRLDLLGDLLGAVEPLQAALAARMDLGLREHNHLFEVMRRATVEFDAA